MEEMAPDEAVLPAQTVFGDGSVAHQIVGAFLTELSAKEGCEEISRRLTNVLFTPKVSEEVLRTAIFGEVEL